LARWLEQIAQSREPAGPLSLAAGRDHLIAGAFADNLALELAKLSRMFRVSHPMELVVLNCWVTETKLTACLSNTSTMREKSSKLRLSRSTL